MCCELRLIVNIQRSRFCNHCATVSSLTHNMGFVAIASKSLRNCREGFAFCAARCRLPVTRPGRCLRGGVTNCRSRSVSGLVGERGGGGGGTVNRQLLEPNTYVNRVVGGCTGGGGGDSNSMATSSSLMAGLFFSSKGISMHGRSSEQERVQGSAFPIHWPHWRDSCARSSTAVIV